MASKLNGGPVDAGQVHSSGIECIERGLRTISVVVLTAISVGRQSFMRTTV